MIDDDEKTSTNSITRESNGTATFVSGNRAKIELWSNVFNFITDDEASLEDNEKTLIKIDYRSSKIRHLDGHIFQALSNLEEIDLSDNELTILGSELFRGLKRLKSINFSLNSISRVQFGLFNSQLERLESVDLQKNQLVNVPRDLSENVKHLRELNLSFNRISNLDENTFADFTELSRVYLNNNSIREIKKGLFETTRNLSVIQFNDNRITFLPVDVFVNCRNLTEIRFSRNRISSLDSTIFRGLSNLNTIDFSHNRISELSADLFIGLSHLQDVNFSFNRITHLNPMIFDSSSSCLKIDFRWDYNLTTEFFSDHDTILDEFFHVMSNNKTASIKAEVFVEYSIMLALSKHEIELPLNDDNSSNLESHLKHHTNTNLFDPKNFSVLDFFLWFVPVKTLINLLDRVKKLNIDESTFRVSNETSVKSLCRLGNEKLVRELGRYFKAVSFKPCFELSLAYENESAAIGFVKLFWHRVKEEYLNRDKTKTNFLDIVTKYEFHLNECVKTGFDRKWWELIRELLDIYEEEKTDIKINMGRFYLTLFEKDYTNFNRQHQTIDLEDENQEENLLLGHSNHRGGDLIYKRFDLSQLSNNPVDEHLLSLVGKSNRNDLIQHQTTKEFVDLKWRHLPKTLYKLYLGFYTAFLILYLINLEIVKRSDMKETSTFLRYFLFFVGILFSVQEVIIYKATETKYPNLLVVVNFPLCVFSLFVDELKWLKTILYAISVILMFVVLVIRSEKITLLRIGFYSAGFKRVVKRSFGLIPIALLCLFAFLIAFRVRPKVDTDETEFYKGPIVSSFVRLLTMSLGEFETSKMGFATIVDYLIFVIYVFLLPLIVVNMFIGVAVDEMRRLADEYEIWAIRVRIGYVLNVQRAFERIARRLTRERFNRLVDKSLMVQVNEVRLINRPEQRLNEDEEFRGVEEENLEGLSRSRLDETSGNELDKSIRDKI